MWFQIQTGPSDGLGREMVNMALGFVPNSSVLPNIDVAGNQDLNYVLPNIDGDIIEKDHEK